MSSDSEPLSRFQPGGRASIINYNIPDSTSYGGQGYIELDVDPDWFASSSRSGVTFPEWVEDRYGIGTEEFQEPVDDQYGDYRRIKAAIEKNEAFRRIKEDLEGQLERGITENAGTPLVVSRGDPRERTVEEMVTERHARESVDRGAGPMMALALRSAEGWPTEVDEEDGPRLTPEGTNTGAESAFDPTLAKSLSPEALTADVLNNNIPLIHTGFSGTSSYVSVPAPREVNPRLMLVERYRISTYLGDYGAGRTLKTFSLLPGEETTISIKTFKQMKERREQSKSILESKSKTAARSFERQVEREQWNKKEHQRSKAWTKKSNWSASGEASVGVNLGVVSFDAGGGGGGGGSSERSQTSKVARTSFAKNTMNAVSESSSEASSHREVEVNTSQEVTEETRHEKTVERTIENINLSRTLNFVFRQLNQEFVTLFHLEDVRVAFTNDTVSTDASGHGVDGLDYREVPLWKLDELLADVVEEGHRDEVKRLVQRELENVVGYDGETHSIVSRGEIENTAGEVVDDYLHVDTGDPHEYEDPRVDPDTEPDQQPIRVPGVILDADRNRMRTDGVVVEALLGKGEALDAYSAGLQRADVSEREIENDRLRAAVERQKLAREIVRNGDEDIADRYQCVFEEAEDDVSFDVVVGSGSHDGETDGTGRPEEPGEPR